MERGKESDKRHLSAMEYKAQEIEKDIRKAQSFEEAVRKAEIATTKPLQDIVDMNTTKTLFGGRKVDTEQIKAQLADIQKQYQVDKLNSEEKTVGK